MWFSNPKLPKYENNPTIDCVISNNRMRGDNGGADGSGNGVLITSMYSPGWKIHHNAIFDSNTAMSGGSNRLGTGMSIGYENSEMYNNIIYKCGGRPDRFQPMYQNNARKTRIHDNYFIEPNIARIARFGDCRESTFENNRVVWILSKGSGKFLLEKTFQMSTYEMKAHESA